ncbi:MAG: MBL fold metallo-hydrolase [Candidatus Aenigmarchaeota archaeon]|nr:MBL fold metallo-hydrolase [Candidatus Aenigmarchaeota archaeon]
MKNITKEPIKVWEDVYQIGGAGISSFDDCSIYLVNAEPELVLIDSGTGESFDKLVENIRGLGLEPEKLSMIIVTHAHIDHIGSLAKLKEKFNSKILAHQLDVEKIESGEKVGAELYGVIYEPCQVDIKLSKDEESLQIGKYEFKLLHIPGHTPGSIACYLDISGKRVLFGQDVHGPYNLPGADPEKAKTSLQKLIDLHSDILCEGHYSIYQPKERVEEYILSYLREL